MIYFSIFFHVRLALALRLLVLTHCLGLVKMNTENEAGNASNAPRGKPFGGYDRTPKSF